MSSTDESDTVTVKYVPGKLGVKYGDDRAVSKVTEGSQSDEQGVKLGWVIESINGAAMKDKASIKDVILAAKGKGEGMTFVYSKPKSGGSVEDKKDEEEGGENQEKVDLKSKTTDAFFAQEKKDPDMIKYLKSLGLDPDYVGPKDDQRRVVIKDVTVEFNDDSKDVVIPAQTPKEIAAAQKMVVDIHTSQEYKFKVTFRVQHELVHGLDVKTAIKKMKITIIEEIEQLGSYPPSNDFTTVMLPKDGWCAAPEQAGFGKLACTVKFRDKDGEEHLKLKFHIKISKEKK